MQPKVLASMKRQTTRLKILTEPGGYHNAFEHLRDAITDTTEKVRRFNTIWQKPKS